MPLAFIPLAVSLCPPPLPVNLQGTHKSPIFIQPMEPELSPPVDSSVTWDESPNFSALQFGPLQNVNSKTSYLIGRKQPEGKYCTREVLSTQVTCSECLVHARKIIY